MDTGIHVIQDGFFALDDELFKERHWSDCRINNTLHHPCKEDFIDFGKIIGLNENRVNKLLKPFLIKQKNVEDLVKKSFLDSDTKSLYLKHYNERLTMLNVI